VVVAYGMQVLACLKVDLLGRSQPSVATQKCVQLLDEHKTCVRPCNTMLVLNITKTCVEWLIAQPIVLNNTSLS
jgi:hypothetical protein